MFVKFGIVALFSLLFFSTNFAIGQGWVSCKDISTEDCEKKARDQSLTSIDSGVNIAGQIKDGKRSFRASNNAPQTAIESSIFKSFAELTARLAYDKCSEETPLSSIRIHPNGNVESFHCESGGISSPKSSANVSLAVSPDNNSPANSAEKSFILQETFNSSARSLLGTRRSDVTTTPVETLNNNSSANLTMAEDSNVLMLERGVSSARNLIKTLGSGLTSFE